MLRAVVVTNVLLLTWRPANNIIRFLSFVSRSSLSFYNANMTTNEQYSRWLTERFFFSFYTHTHAHTLQLVWYYYPSIFFLLSCCSDRMTTNFLFLYLFLFAHMIITCPWETMMVTFIFVVIHANNGISVLKVNEK